MLPLTFPKENVYAVEDEDSGEDEESSGEDEDWTLFMLKLGQDGTPRTLPNEIEKIARCIVKRFKGLPLAISVMARIMKGIDDIHQWHHVLNKLTKLEMGQELEEEVFKVLKSSFDNLMEKNLQNCFLYCALYFGETFEGLDDEEIKKDELIMKLVDDGQINGKMGLKEIFDEGNTILNTLEAHSLISIYNNYSVSTHPLVSNMACYILKESQRNVPHQSRKHFGAEEETANKDVSKVIQFDQDINCDILIFVQNVFEKEII